MGAALHGFSGAIPKHQGPDSQFPIFVLVPPLGDTRLGEFQQQDEDAEQQRCEQHGNKQHGTGMPYTQ